MEIIQIVYKTFFKVHRRDVFRVHMVDDYYRWVFADNNESCILYVESELLNRFLESEEDYYNVNR